MTLVAYPTKKGLRYGYVFWWHGKRFKRRVGSKSLAALAEKRERQRLDVRAFEGEWGPVMPTMTPWSETVERYLQAKANKSSLSVDRQRLAWWGAYFAGRKITHLHEITPEQIDAGKAALQTAGMAPATIRGYLAALRGLLQLAVRRWNLLQRNPTQAIDWPQVRPKEIRIPDARERQELLDAADPVLRLLILTCLYTGLRKASVLRLEAKDCQVRPGWIRSVQKGNREVWVPLADPLLAALAPLILRGGRLFRNEKGEPLPSWPEKRWRAVRMAAGLPWLRVHDLRHTVGSLLGEAGIPQRIIQEYLGHATIQMSQRYTHPMKQGMEEAARQLAKAVLQPARRTRNRTRKAPSH